MVTNALWTIDELIGLVAAALAVDYPGVPTGRVRDLPDRRAVRWYVTRGLVDRPAAVRGRQVVYGRRHLLQLVAIKRRQAQGRTLAEIQAELTGAPDVALEAVARIPNHVIHQPDPVPTDRSAAAVPPPPTRPRFWAAGPVAATPAAAAPVAAGPVAAGPPPDPDTPTLTSRPVAVTAPSPPAGAPAPDAGSPVPDHDDSPRAWPIRGVPLAPGVTLLVDGPAGALDPAAVRAAARPLLALIDAANGTDPSTRTDPSTGIEQPTGTDPSTGTEQPTRRPGPATGTQAATSTETATGARPATSTETATGSRPATDTRPGTGTQAGTGSGAAATTGRPALKKRTT